MRWLWLLFALGGLLLFFRGAFALASGLQAPAEPTPVSIAELEAGTRPDSPYVELGPHLALLHAAVPIEHGSQREFEGALYPVVSADHELAQAWRDLSQRFSSAEEVPETLLPPIRYVDVFVWRRDFADRAAIPGGYSDSPALRGMAVKGSTLQGPALSALYDLMYGTGPTEVVVIEAGREPAGGLDGIVTLLVGALLFGWAFGRWRTELATSLPGGAAGPDRYDMSGGR